MLRLVSGNGLSFTLKTPVVSRRVDARRGCRGFIISYILVAIAMLSALAFFASRVSSAIAAGNEMQNKKVALIEQVGLIRSVLTACGINYPAGDNGLGYRIIYPVAPVSGLVRDLECPGAPVGSKSLWPGVDGVFMPVAINGFSAWGYVHDAASIRIAISATDLGAPTLAAIESARIRLGAEASVSGGGGTLTVVLMN